MITLCYTGISSSVFLFLFLWSSVFRLLQLQDAIKSAEAGREDLEDRLADMMDKLREARVQAEEAVSCHVTELKIKQFGLLQTSPYLFLSQRFTTVQLKKKLWNFALLFFIFFVFQNARHDRQRQMLENKVQALENELEAAKNRLQSLRAQAEERVRKMTKQMKLHFFFFPEGRKNYYWQWHFHVETADSQYPWDTCYPSPADDFQIRFLKTWS